MENNEIMGNEIVSFEKNKNKSKVLLSLLSIIILIIVSTVIIYFYINSNPLLAIKYNTNKLTKNLTEQIEQQEKKYEELSVVIKQAKQDYVNHQEKSVLQDNLNEIVYKRLEQFITKIDLCSNLLNLDSMRCKIELDNMKKSVLDMQHELQEVFQPYNTIKNNDVEKNE